MPELKDIQWLAYNKLLGIPLQIMLGKYLKAKSHFDSGFTVQTEKPLSNKAVIFVHGRNSNCSVFSYLISEHLVNYPGDIILYNYDIEHRIPLCVQDVLCYIDSAKNYKEISIVGYSKGGVVAYLAALVSKRIHHLITISSPFGGTFYSKIPFLSSKPSISEFKNVMLYTKPQIMGEFLNLYSRLDQMVLPNSNLLHLFAENRRFDTYGHFSCLLAHESQRLISKLLVENKLLD